MSRLRRDLAIAFLIALIVNSAIFGWLFFEQRSLRVDASDEFSKVYMGMTRPEVERALARDHLIHKYGNLYFRDLLRSYAIFFDDEGKVDCKVVGSRDYFHTMRF